MMHSTRSGFTLVEMAIVITEIGLLVGGVIAGKSILDASERRSVLADIERFGSITSSFLAKYNGLPGDFYDATTVWGAAHTTPATCITTVSNSAATCNGDGDGMIGDTGNEYEMFRVWQQLVSAGLYEGRFSGTVGGGGTTAAIPGHNVPESKFKSGGYTLRYLRSGSGNYYTADDYGHIIEFGAGTTTTYSNGVILTPEEALSIDSKADDGMPGTGIIRSYTNTARSNCADSNTRSTAVYRATQDVIGCNLVFITGF